MDEDFLIPLNESSSSVFKLNCKAHLKFTFFEREDIVLLWGSISHCDNYNFGVAGNTFLSLGKITVCPEGFSASVLVEGKRDGCMKSQDAATIILHFFCCFIGLRWITGSSFPILLWDFHFTSVAGKLTVVHTCSVSSPGLGEQKVPVIVVNWSSSGAALF